MKSEKEIMDRINAVDAGIKEDYNNKKNQDATDKAIYITALKWVIGE